ncbi:MAG: tetratricopeptide repeat protein [Planctomycetes bacterium]|nr:tetratricopeptide repeat protein [Planctomycetota bacterium]
MPKFRFLPLDAERARRLGLPPGRGVPYPARADVESTPFSLERMVGYIEDYRQAKPEDADYDAFLVRYYHHRGLTVANQADLPAGLGWLRKALELDPENPGVLHDLARICFDLGKMDDARDAYDSILRLGGETLETFDGLARTYACLGLLRRAVELAEDAHRKYPEDPRALDLLTTLLYHTGDVARLEKHLFELMETDSGNPQALEKLGVYLRDCGRLGEAKTCLERALALEPKSWRLRYQFALLVQSQGDLVAADAALDGILKERPEEVDVLIALGRLRLGRRQLPAAEALFERALRAAPRDYRGHLGLAQALLDREPPDAERAIVHLATLLELPEVDAEALSLVCVTAHEHGREELAEQAEAALARLQEAGRRIREEEQ